ncbi:hypothetical protein EDEG_01139, partial [Edhazardia aedis USNM 41457]
LIEFSNMKYNSIETSKINNNDKSSVCDDISIDKSKSLFNNKGSLDNIKQSINNKIINKNIDFIAKKCCNALISEIVNSFDNSVFKQYFDNKIFKNKKSFDREQNNLALDFIKNDILSQNIIKKHNNQDKLFKNSELSKKDDEMLKNALKDKIELSFANLSVLENKLSFQNSIKDNIELFNEKLHANDDFLTKNNIIADNIILNNDNLTINNVNSLTEYIAQNDDRILPNKKLIKCDDKTNSNNFQVNNDKSDGNNNLLTTDNLKIVDLSNSNIFPLSLSDENVENKIFIDILLKSNKILTYVLSKYSPSNTELNKINNNTKKTHTSNIKTPKKRGRPAIKIQENSENMVTQETSVFPVKRKAGRPAKIKTPVVKLVKRMYRRKKPYSNISAKTKNN